MNEGTYAIQQRRQLEHDLDTARQDLEELRQNISKVLRYLDALPDNPITEAIRLRVSALLNIGAPIDPREGGEQLEIFSIEVAAQESEKEVPEQTLQEWAAEVEQKFNDMTVETSDGLRMLAAREAT